MLPRCDWAAGFFGFWSLALAPVGVIAGCLCAWGLGRLVMQEGSCSECLFVFRSPAVFLLTGGCYEVVAGIFVLPAWISRWGGHPSEWEGALYHRQ